MVKFIYLVGLICQIGYSQNTTYHMYYATAKIAGLEILFHVRDTKSTYLGFGLSGVSVKDRATGDFIDKKIRPDEEIYATTYVYQPVSSVYMIGSLGYHGPLLIKGKAGIGFNYLEQNFRKDEFEYYKVRSLTPQFLIGIGAYYPFNDTFGVEAGLDTFNKVTLGLTASF